MKKEYDLFDDAKQCVFNYIHKTGIQLCIRSSKKNRSCIFDCSQHSKCPFEIRINKVWLEDKWVIHGRNLNHCNIKRDTKDGRKKKKENFLDKMLTIESANVSRTSLMLQIYRRLHRTFTASH